MTTRTSTTPPTSAEVGWRRRLRQAWQMFRGVVGADAYEVYLEHQRRTHPDQPVMCKKDFWRDKTDRQDKNPSVRCC